MKEQEIGIMENNYFNLVMGSLQTMEAFSKLLMVNGVLAMTKQQHQMLNLNLRRKKQ